MTGMDLFTIFAFAAVTTTLFFGLFWHVHQHESGYKHLALALIVLGFLINLK